MILFLPRLVVRQFSFASFPVRRLRVRSRYQLRYGLGLTSATALTDHFLTNQGVEHNRWVLTGPITDDSPPNAAEICRIGMLMTN